MKKYFLVLFLFIILVACKNFFYGTTMNFYYVHDYRYWQYGIPSYQVNTSDRYCVFFVGLTTNYDNEEISKQTAFSFLKNKNVKIKEELLFRGDIPQPDKLNEIKQRELDNNFKNCDYLIEFSLSNSLNYKKQIVLRIIIDDIKTNKNIGFYRMQEMDNIFKKTTQEQKIEKMLNEWWETQIKPQPKARPLERYCVGNCDNKL